ncbi:MAG: N-acetyltransferase [Pseudomonadales bacterium]|nr:N-acetyltransferase [Pseudomonadales bacterium]
MSAVRIVPLRNRADREAFLRLPWQIFADDPAWVPPLLFDRREQIDERRNPFFRHAEWQGFLALRDGQPVGRISAQIDRLNADLGRPELGYFGLLDAIDDPAVFAALLGAAEAWLRARGMRRTVGPFNLGINQEVGLLVDGFDTPPYFMMTHARRWYEPHVRAAGYAVARELLAYELSPRFPRPPLMTSLMRRMGERLVVRPLDRRDVAGDLATVCDIFNDAWANNWLFVPFTREEFVRIGKEMLLVIGPDFIQIAELDGIPAAFIVMLPNVNACIRDLDGRIFPTGWAKLLWRLKVRYPDTGRVPLMGVRRAHQHTRFGPGLAFAVIDAICAPALARGIENVELSWILEDNAGMRHIIETIGGRVSKRYHMYEKSLVPAADPRTGA